MSHYEKLKAMKTGFSDDFRTAIYADRISSHYVSISGIPPLILPDCSGQPLKSWSFTGHTDPYWNPRPSNEFNKSLWMRDGDSSIFDNGDGSFAIRTVAYQERRNRYNIPDNTKDYCLSFTMRWDYYDYADRTKFRITGIKTDGTEEAVKEFSYFAGTQKVSVVLPANTYSAFAFGGWVYEGLITVSNIALNKGTVPYDAVKGVGDYDAETGKYKISVVNEGVNLFNKDDLKPNTRLGGDGQFYTQNGYYATINYIPVSPNKVYSASWSISSMITVWIYDKDYVPLQRIQDYSSSFVVPSNGRYIRCSVTTAMANTATITRGSTPLPYTPYRTPITTPIYISSPLMAGEILRSNGTITRSDGTTEIVTVPQLSASKGTNIISAETEVQPKYMTAVYRGGKA